MDEEREITAPMELQRLQAGWAARSGAQPRLHTIVRMGAKTDLGRVRENNEDKFDFLEPEDPGVLATRGRVYAVADGMGGHAAGQIAAEVALNTFIRAYFTDASDDPQAALKQAVQIANGYLVEIARTIRSRSGMGTTLTAAVLRENELLAVQVGDSRLYLLRDGELRQITEDHSWVAEQVRRGALTEEEAELSPFRNVITRSLGGAPEVEPDLYAVQVQAGDRYLLCSDGLSGMVSADEIREILATESPSMVAWDLVQRANDCGGKDNITALVLDVLAVIPWEELAQEVSEIRSEAVSAGGEPALAVAPTSPVGRRRGLIAQLFRRGGR
ncbi:MAG: Stp1/IreP family PP2C-type Ser/Thr phosphatase [Armatimonadetes bacterium]|nr:Stp1/IreP family PP2C-type Ser/Thr phosphatase [Armatimonadota bacterium]